MLHYPLIDPIAFHLGPLSVHWYGLMYVLGILSAFGLGLYRASQPFRQLSSNQVSDVLLFASVGILLGGRLGYMLFYDTMTLWMHPFSLFQIWNGGMSFHGGFLGALAGTFWYSLKVKKNFFILTDFFAPMVPIGLCAGRLGNFINGELWGKVTTSKVGMIFPSGGPLPRYPSQLLEAVLEGVILFVILWTYSAKPRPIMSVSACFLVGYSVFRFFSEFFREPDIQRGYLLWNWVTEGQLLSLPMFFFGIIFWILVYLRRGKVT